MNLIQSTEVRGQVTPLFTHIQLNFESNCQMVTNARLKMEKKIVWLQIKIKVRLFRSNAFPAESHQCTLHYCTLHWTSLHFLLCHLLHWPVHSSRESPMHFALLNFASLLSGHHFTSRLVMPSTDLICTDQCTAAESHQCILHYQLLHFVFSLVFALDFTCFLCNLLICTDQ